VQMFECKNTYLLEIYRLEKIKEEHTTKLKCLNWLSVKLQVNHT